MDLYIYETPDTQLADFRPYLDGRDHSFDDHRELPSGDARWEKIATLRDPVSRTSLGGSLRFVGTAQVKWRELMVFPIVWDGEFEPVEWEPGEDAC